MAPIGSILTAVSTVLAADGPRTPLPLRERATGHQGAPHHAALLNGLKGLAKFPALQHALHGPLPSGANPEKAALEHREATCQKIWHLSCKEGRNAILNASATSDDTTTSVVVQPRATVVRFSVINNGVTLIQRDGKMVRNNDVSDQAERITAGQQILATAATLVTARGQGNTAPFDISGRDIHPLLKGAEKMTVKMNGDEVTVVVKIGDRMFTVYADGENIPSVDGDKKVSWKDLLSAVPSVTKN